MLKIPPMYLTILPNLTFIFNYICCSLITTHLLIWQAEKENRENKSFGSMCIDDNITRINMLFLEINRRYSSLSTYDTGWSLNILLYSLMIFL